MSHHNDTNDEASEGSEQEPLDSDSELEYEDEATRISWKKWLFIVVAVVVVWTIVESRRRVGWEIEWRHDLDACLADAKGPPRKAVILLVHRKGCTLTEDIDRDIFSLQHIYKWAMRGIPCRLVWEEHPEIVRKYDLKESPTLLMLSPEGEDVFRWSGQQITPHIRKRFHKYATGETDEGTYRSPSTRTGSDASQ